MVTNGFACVVVLVSRGGLLWRLVSINQFVWLIGVCLRMWTDVELFFMGREKTEVGGKNVSTSIKMVLGWFLWGKCVGCAIGKHR